MILDRTMTTIIINNIGKNIARLALRDVGTFRTGTRPLAAGSTWASDFGV